MLRTPAQSPVTGRPIANLSIATSDSWRDKATGERREKTEWHRVVIFNEKLAEVAQKYIKKGSKVYVEGQLATRKWTDQQGQERYTTEVVIPRFGGALTMLDGRSGGGGGILVDLGLQPGKVALDLRLALVERGDGRGAIGLHRFEAEIDRVGRTARPAGTDRLIARGGLRLMREMMAKQPFDEFRGEELTSSKGAVSDDALDAHARRTCSTVHHPLGTCRMGADGMSVVDPELRVRGVEGLRVVDASIMPTITGGNTHAPALMIGEKAADILLGRKAR